MAQIEQEMPWSSQQQLAHNNFWEKQIFHRLLFLCLFGLFTLDENVFVTDLIVDNVVIQVQGFSSGILIILFEKLCVLCEGIWINMWLPCTVNV